MILSRSVVQVPVRAEQKVNHRRGDASRSQTLFFPVQLYLFQACSNADLHVVQTYILLRLVPAQCDILFRLVSIADLYPLQNYTTKGLSISRLMKTLLRTLSGEKCLFGPYINHGVVSCLPTLLYRQA